MTLRVLLPLPLLLLAPPAAAQADVDALCQSMAEAVFMMGGARYNGVPQAQVLATLATMPLPATEIDRMRLAVADLYAMPDHGSLEANQDAVGQYALGLQGDCLAEFGR